MFDLNSIRLVAMISFTCFTVAIVMLWRLVPQERSLKYWALATMLVAVGFLLLGLRGVIPNFISITIANTILILGVGYTYVGTSNLLGGGKIDFRWIWFAAIATFFIGFSQNLSFRFPAYALLDFPFFALCAWLFWRAKGNLQIVVVQRIAAIIFAIGALMFMSRVFKSPPTSAPSINIIAPNWLEVVPYVYAIMFSMWLSMTLLLIVSFRLQSQRADILISLSEKEERLRLALTSANQAWFDLNVVTGEVLVSQELPLMLGYAPATFHSSLQDWLGSIYPEDVGAVREAMQECLKDGGPKSLDYRRRTSAGEWLWFNSISSITKWDQNHQPLRMIGIHTNINERKQLETLNQESLVALRRAESVAKLGNWNLDIKTGKLGWSDEVFNIFEIDKDQFKPSYEAFIAAIHPEDRVLVDSAYTNSLVNKEKYNITHRLLMKDGRVKYVTEQCENDFDEAGNPLHSIGTIQDITERWHVDNATRIAATVFESQEGMMVTDPNSIILRVNHAFTKITGYSAEEVIGQTPRLLSSARQSKEFYAAMWQNINTTGTWEGEIWNRRKNGEIYPEHITISAVKDTTDIVTNYVATLTDITMSKAAADEIKSLAFYDPLTQLPNRRLLLDRLTQALATSARSGQRGALLFMDLDHFKILNDTLGHGIGDILLQQVAARLTACVREGDTISRLGGDEFVVLLENLSKKMIEAAAQTKEIAQKILLALNQPYQLDTHGHHSTPSIGATLFKGHEQTTEELLKQADIAMYQSKSEGRNTMRFFDPKMQEAIAVRVDLEHELRKAIEQHQFQLHYQIQVDSNGRAVGAEALIRWQHPERGMISPFHFIPLAEDTGLILPIGQWVLDTACAQLKVWQQSPLTQDLALSINVSAKQFFQADFVEKVQAALLQHQIVPKHLKLELTESMLVDNINDIIAKMDVLSKVGICFSLDDFGTGYSSLQYLKKLPLAQLKIDQSFVRDLVTDASDLAIVRTIITMAHSLDINVIAEGVETAEQRQYLLDHGCMDYQGYLFSKPVPIDEFEALLSKS